MVIIAGIISGLLSYIFNKWALKDLKNKGLIIAVPIIEESTKTMSAIIIGTSIVGTHFIFGIIEGIYDIVNSPKKIGKWAALASILSHSFFGLITQLTINIGYPIYWGIFLSWLIHSTWNWYITKHI